VIEFFTDNL